MHGCIGSDSVGFRVLHGRFAHDGRYGYELQGGRGVQLRNVPELVDVQGRHDRFELFQLPAAVTAIVLGQHLRVLPRRVDDEKCGRQQLYEPASSVAYPITAYAIAAATYAITAATYAIVGTNSYPRTADGHGCRVEHEHGVDSAAHRKRNRNGFELSGAAAVCAVRAVP